MDSTSRNEANAPPNDTDADAEFNCKLRLHLGDCA